MSPLLVGLALAVGAPGLKGDKPPAPNLYGEWEFVSTEEEGKVFPAEDPPTRFRFNRDGTYQVFRGGKEVAGRRGFQFDPKADPPTLDYNTAHAGKLSPTLLCVYRLNGDELTVCRAGPDQPRPAQFAAPAGSGLLVVRFRRVKPEK
jgi:uncharacterized protein (TIGR03067 family)